jgi:hypothetical protein
VNCHQIEHLLVGCSNAVAVLGLIVAVRNFWYLLGMVKQAVTIATFLDSLPLKVR